MIEALDDEGADYDGYPVDEPLVEQTSVDEPVVVEEPPVYVERPPAAPPAPPAPAASTAYWYYCSSAKGYYPTVPSCPEEWVKVPERPR